MRTLRIILVAFVILASTLACGLGMRRGGGGASSATQGAPELAISPRALTLPPTETTAPTDTATPQPTAAPSATATQTPIPTIASVVAQTWAQNVQLRSGPGKFFPAVASLKQDTQVTVIAKARGDDWLLADTPQGQGWISTQFISQAAIDALPAIHVVEVPHSLELVGRVTDVKGAGVPGVEFAAFDANDRSEAPPDTRAHSLADGHFYLYLPENASGVWRVSLTAVDCKSPAVDKNCRIAGAFVPRYTDVTLPAGSASEVTFQFNPE